MTRRNAGSRKTGRISHVVTSDGVHLRFTWFDAISHRKFSPITQAYGICFSPEGKVFVGKQPPRFDHWTLPGGTIEKGETPEQALIRELDEELSLQTVRFKLLGAQKVECLNRKKKPHYQLRYAVLVRPKRLTPDPDHAKAWKRKAIDRKRFSQYIDWGPIAEHLIVRASAWFDKQKPRRKTNAQKRQG